MTLEEALAKIAELQESVEATAAKNAELLTKLAKAKKAATNEITPEQLAEVEAERDKLQAELVEARKLGKQVETLTKELQVERSFTGKLLVDDGLTKALTQAGVTNPVRLKAATAMLRAGVELKDRKALVEGKELADFVKEWAAGDEGKHFVEASLNSGGGAPGGAKDAGGGKTMTRAQFDAADHATRAAFSKDGGKVID